MIAGECIVTRTEGGFVWHYVPDDTEVIAVSREAMDQILQTLKDAGVQP
jgi:hypothetical protein